ncbi:MAG: glycosyltransferase family 39 protein [Anaerolineales bacterium]
MMQTIKKQWPQKLGYLPVVFLIFTTLWLHLVNLGYSDYQGDEISALPLQGSNQNLIDFLLTQKKGPVQFLVTQLVKFVDPGFSNRFLARLPFALAGILAIYFFYKLVDLHFGKKVALYAALFLSANGLIVGLTRIVQYQGFVMLFSVAALYALSLAVSKEQWRIKGLYIGMLLWALALLSHYDGIFIAPFAAILLYRWYSTNPEIPHETRRKHLIISSIVAILLLVVFYIPLLFSLSDQAKLYFSSRLIANDINTSLVSSVTTFRIYNPLIVFYIYLVLGNLSLFKFREAYPVLAWFLFPYQVLDILIYEPGTHIYTYIIPATILLGLGLAALEGWMVKILGRVGEVVNFGGLVLLFAFITSLSHFIFVDHTPEYPWENRGYLAWMIQLPQVRTTDLWLFGFPYYRHWDEVAAYVKSNSDIKAYATNEKMSISDFHISLAYDPNKAGYYIYVHNAQSFKDTIANDKVRYWTKNYPPDKVFKNDGRVVVEIYKMPPGDVNEIKAEGY